MKNTTFPYNVNIAIYYRGNACLEDNFGNAVTPDFRTSIELAQSYGAGYDFMPDNLDALMVLRDKFEARTMTKEEYKSQTSSLRAYYYNLYKSCN